MLLEKIDEKINNLVEMAKPEMKGLYLKLLTELRDDIIQQTIFEFTKGMDSMVAHIGKEINKNLKVRKEAENSKESQQ